MKQFLIGLLLVLVAVPVMVSAQGLNNALGNLRNVGDRAGTSQSADLEVVVGKIINAALSLIGIIFLVLMVYAGYLWMTARGEDEQINKAKNIIKSSIIGIIITVSAYAITFFVVSRLSQNSSQNQQTPPQGQVRCCVYRESGVNRTSVVATSEQCDNLCSRSGGRFTQCFSELVANRSQCN